MPFHGRFGSAKEESLGTTKLLDKPKSTILKLRSDGVVPVRTTFFLFVVGEGGIASRGVKNEHYEEKSKRVFQRLGT